jgi:hypothetical protein
MNEAHSPVLEICAKAEERIREAQRLLLDPRPATLDQVVAELAEVIGALRAIAAERPTGTELRGALHRIRAMTRLLAKQIEYASNLNMGFVQLRLAHGYTRQGLPFVHNGARNSVEA